ncbi:MAG: hypothetical protein ACI4MN_07500 [Candidatus Coproplasma sp.]
MANHNSNEVQLNVKRVAASLTRGQIYSGRIWVTAYVLIFVLVMPVIIGSVVAGIIENDLLYAVGVPSFGVVLIFVGVFLLFTVEGGKKWASKCLEDAVVVEAKCTSLGSVPVFRFPALYAKAIAIEVTFIYNDNLYIKQSKRKGKLVYLNIFNKYANRKIMIAYSQKYDEVLILND